MTAGKKVCPFLLKYADFTVGIQKRREASKKKNVRKLYQTRGAERLLSTRKLTAGGAGRCGIRYGAATARKRSRRLRDLTGGLTPNMVTAQSKRDRPKQRPKGQGSRELPALGPDRSSKIMPPIPGGITGGAWGRTNTRSNGPKQLQNPTRTSSKKGKSPPFASPERQQGGKYGNAARSSQLSSLQVSRKR